MIMSKLKDWCSKHPGWTTVFVIVGLFVIGGYVGDDNVNSQDLSTSVYKATNAPVDVDLPSVDVVKVVPKETAADSYVKSYNPEPVQESYKYNYGSGTGLSNDNYYINTYGNEVHSPAYSNTVPAGASAQCMDGTYSFSQSRRGTCSHHGGVAQWL